MLWILACLKDMELDIKNLIEGAFTEFYYSGALHIDGYKGASYIDISNIQKYEQQFYHILIDTVNK